MRERNYRGAESFPMSVFAATVEREAREIIPRVIGRECAKILAFKAGSTKRSAINWQNGEHLPSVPHFIALARQYPELKRKVLEWLEASTGDNERDPQQVLSEIARLLQRNA